MSNLLRKEKRGSAQDSSVSHNRPASKSRVPGPVPVPVRGRSPAPASSFHGDSEDVVCVPILSYEDILEARKRGRELAVELGFSSIDCTLVATAISELARNIVLYAGHGEIQLSRDERLGFTGIVITAADQGPGIRDVRSALQEGYSTSRGLGLGLPGVKRIMDEFDIQSKPKQGATVTVKRWKAN